MDVFVKAAPDDLKFSFSNILSMDFFGKKLEFYFLKGPDDWQLIDSAISFDENDCIMKYLEKNTNAEVKMTINKIRMRSLWRCFASNVMDC